VTCWHWERELLALLVPQAYVAKGEEMLRKTTIERFLPNGSQIPMAMWLKAIYHDSGVTRTPEETILKAYDTMTGVEKPAFAKV